MMRKPETEEETATRIAAFVATRAKAVKMAKEADGTCVLAEDGSYMTLQDHIADNLDRFFRLGMRQAIARYAIRQAV